MLLQRLKVCSLVVVVARLPAAEEDPEPFKAERSKNAPMSLAGGPLVVIEGLRPGRRLNGLAGPLDDGLMNELGSAEPSLNAHRPVLSSGPLRDRCYASEYLK